MYFAIKTQLCKMCRYTKNENKDIRIHWTLNQNNSLQFAANLEMKGKIYPQQIGMRTRRLQYIILYIFNCNSIYNSRKNSFLVSNILILTSRLPWIYRYFNIMLFSNLFHYIKQKSVGIFLLYSRNVIAWQLTLFIFSKIENCI